MRWQPPKLSCSACARSELRCDDCTLLARRLVHSHACKVLIPALTHTAANTAAQLLTKTEELQRRVIELEGTVPSSKNEELVARLRRTQAELIQQLTELKGEGARLGHQCEGVVALQASWTSALRPLASASRHAYAVIHVPMAHARQAGSTQSQNLRAPSSGTGLQSKQTHRLLTASCSSSRSLLR